MVIECCDSLDDFVMIFFLGREIFHWLSGDNHNFISSLGHTNFLMKISYTKYSVF